MNDSAPERVTAAGEATREGQKRSVSGHSTERNVGTMSWVEGEEEVVMGGGGGGEEDDDDDDDDDDVDVDVDDDTSRERRGQASSEEDGGV